jgi:hypothetical protein
LRRESQYPRDPEQETATVFRLAMGSQSLGKADLLDLGDVVPGFSCCLAEILGS